MERILVIDDKFFKKELDVFLKKHKKRIKVDTRTENIARALAVICESSPASHSKEQRLLINTANTSILVKVQDIIRCQSNRNYTELHLQNKSKITVSKPLKQFAQLEILKSFARVHLSHLVNINYIDRFIKSDGGSLVLTNGTKLPVSKRRRDEWIKKLDII
ncbi:MAG: LytTR family transcriptional regulator [Bacteroidia bacterium]|nr:LytTR family transcriptional regulator [Bacteroidia bacterium]